MNTPRGFVAEVGSDNYTHAFGGARWKISSESTAVPPPLMILTLDLADPRLELELRGEMPICSRVDGVSMERQSYRFDSESSTIRFEGPGWDEEATAELPDPLPLRPLKLRPTRPEEDPTLTDKYQAQDTFVGGNACLRVRGEPVWLDKPEQVVCSCAREMQFVAGIGYESSRSSTIIDDQTPFFFGELALYFFACLPCRRVTVTSQST